MKPSKMSADFYQLKAGMFLTPFLRRLMTIAAVFAAVSSFASADTQIQGFELQTSYEEWKLPRNETMGMARIGLREKFGRYFNAGVDSYAAAQGERGGFIKIGRAHV